MNSFSFMDEIEEIENLQREFFSMKEPDFEEYLDEKNKYIMLLDTLKYDQSNEELKRELEDLVEILNKQISLYDMKKLKNNELALELEKAKNNFNDFKNEISTEQLRYEKEITSVENSYQQEVLRNIERRNYLQKLKIIRLENKHKKNKYNH